MQKKSIIRQIILLVWSRLEVLYAWPFIAVCGAFLAAGGWPPLLATLLLISGIALTTLSAYIYNDLLDAEQDKLNAIKGKRPLARQQVSESVARGIISVSGVAGCLLLTFVHPMSFLFGFLYYVLFMVYSWRPVYLKKRFLLKELSISLAMPLNGLAGMYAASGEFYAEVFLALMVIAFFAFTAQPVIADSSDIKEDKLSGIRTLGILLTWRTKYLMLAGGVFMVGVFLVLLYRYYAFNDLLLKIALPATAIALSGLVLFQNAIKTRLPLLRKLGNAHYVILIIAFIAGLWQG